MNAFGESDWRIFRELNPIVYDRLCQRILSQIRTELDHPETKAHDKLAAIRQALRYAKDETNLMFDHFSRSYMSIQLTAMFTRNLLTPEEIARFTPETQAYFKDVLNR